MWNAVISEEVAMDEADSDNRVHMPSYGNGRVEIKGLTPVEIDLLHGVINGHNWASVGTDGRLRCVPTRNPLPGPTEDIDMMPFWRRRSADNDGHQLHFLGDEPPYEHYSPSISIQSLCGYYYTPEKYAQEARKLETYGFECLRSRRGTDGKFTEAWYLPGLWAARGELRDVIAKIGTGQDWPQRAKLEAQAASRFLCSHVMFGTMDMMVQRAAMTVD